MKDKSEASAPSTQRQQGAQAEPEAQSSEGYVEVNPRGVDDGAHVDVFAAVAAERARQAKQQCTCGPGDGCHLCTNKE